MANIQNTHNIILPTWKVQGFASGKANIIRLPIDPQPKVDAIGVPVFADVRGKSGVIELPVQGCKAGMVYTRCLPPYRPGDILCVQETWAYGKSGNPLYKADMTRQELTKLRQRNFRWNTPSTMPQQITRLFLQVTSIELQPLRSLAPESFKYEGILPNGEDKSAFRLWQDYKSSWNSWIPQDKLKYLGTGANPWVWTFSVTPVRTLP